MPHSIVMKVLFWLVKCTILACKCTIFGFANRTILDLQIAPFCIAKLALLECKTGTFGMCILPNDGMICWKKDTKKPETAVHIWLIGTAVSGKGMFRMDGWRIQFCHRNAPFPKARAFAGLFSLLPIAKLCGKSSGLLKSSWTGSAVVICPRCGGQRGGLDGEYMECRA